MSKKIYLVDGYGFVFRAYHSMPPLTNPEGVVVGAVYGFVNMLTKVLNDHKPDYMAVVFDAGKKTFRNDIYPEYKANRPPAPDDLVPQFPIVRDAAQALGLQTLEKVGYEADDIIATLAQRAKDEGLEVVIISSDKDLMQLVGDGVVMFDAMKNKIIDVEQVEEKFGVKPNKVLDVLSLMGDASDNVPGVPSIGPKTASLLINEFNSLDELLERTDEIPQNKRREALQEYVDQAKLSRDLIRLHYEVPLEVDFDKLTIDNDNSPAFAEFCEKHNFKSIRQRRDDGKESITASASAPKPVVKSNKPETSISIIEDENALKDFIEKADKRGKFSIYFLSDVGMAFSLLGGQSFFLKYSSHTPLGGFDFTEEKGLSEPRVFELLGNIINEPEVLKISYDLKAAGHTNISPMDDIMVMTYVLNTGITSGDISYLEPDIPKLEGLIGKGKDKRTLAEIEAKELAEFACTISSELIYQHAILRQELFDKKLMTIYERLEKPLIAVLKRMENYGAKIDASYLANLSSQFGGEIAKLEKDIYSLAGREFNIGSPKQLGEVLFEELGLTAGKKNKKSGNLSTSAKILEDLATEGHEVVQKVLDWRGLSKLKSTYTDSLQKEINPKTGRVHTTFLMTSTNTGRLSSNSPNVQNIPIRSEEGRKIRSAFITEAGNKMLSVDYSQIELRLLAHVGKIEPLIDAFKNGHDIHAVTAHQVFGVPLDAVDAEHRRKAKTINFGIIYGLSAHGLSERLKISRVEAKDYIDQYFAQYPGIRQYMSDTTQFCKEHGYVETIFGRRCYIKGINDKNGAVRQFSERAAINAPLQGSAADIIKRAMIDLHNANLPMTLQVHDELLFEVPEAEAENAKKKIVNIMQNAAQLNVPLIVDANIGDNWGEVH